MSSLRIWCDVYNAAGVRQGDGPITTIIQVSVKRVLDNAGTITFSTFATDQRALTLLTVRARIRLFIDNGDGGRELCRGMILERKIQESASGRTMSFTCIDVLGELKDKNLLIGYQIDAENLDNALNNLLTPASWTYNTINVDTGATLVNLRSDGSSYLKVLQEIAKITGLHFRLSPTIPYEIDFGGLGDLSDVGLMNVAHASEIADNANIGVIDNISVEDDGEGVVNWIIPLGGGTDAGALKLKRSSRTTPYTIENDIGPNGKKYWYIKDDASIALYGEVQRIIYYKEIFPIVNTPSQKENAADQLYDASAAFLQRAAVLKKTYKVGLQGVTQTLYPGDKINIRYKGIVYRDGVELDYLDLNDDFWIMNVSETIGVNGRAVSITISNTDTETKSAVQKIASIIDDVEVQKLKPITSTYARTFVYSRDMTPSINAKVSVLVTNTTLELIRAKVKFETFAAEYHRHSMFLTGSSASAPGAGDWFSATALDFDGGTQTIVLAGTSGIPNNLYTDLANRFIEGSIFPVGIGVIIDGVDRTTALGGPWQPVTSAAIEVDLDVGDVTGWFNDDLYRKHTLEFYCTNYEGRIEITVELYEVGQSITIDT